MLIIQVVKDLLTQYYGRPRASLTVNSPPADITDKTVYCCSINATIEVTAASLLAFLNNIKPKSLNIPHLEQKINHKDGVGGNHPGCVYFRESGEQWFASFYSITSISYRQTFGRRITAEFQLSKKPLFTLSNAETGMGLFIKGKGLPYRINKALFTDSRFRLFVLDLLSNLGENESYFRFVSQAISKHHCFLPRIGHEDLIKCENVEECLAGLVNIGSFPNGIPKALDLNSAYSIAFLTDYVARDDWPLLANVKPHIIAKSINLNFIYERNPRRFLTNILEDRYAESGDYELAAMADQYVEAALEAGQKIRLGLNRENLIRAYSGLKQEDGLPLIMRSEPNTASGISEGNDDFRETFTAIPF